MSKYYRISNPDDVRDLGNQMAEWSTTSNPKADEWLPQPPQPTPESSWQNGQWIEPPPPPPPQWENVQSFMAAFTMQEKAAIALSTDPTIAALRLELTTWLSSVQADSDAVQTGLDKLVDLQILTPQRKTEILATAT